MGLAKECPIFHPSMEEFRNFDTFMYSISTQLAAAGMCKIVPPKDWDWPIIDPASLDDKIIQSPIKQVVSGRTGVYSIDNVEQRNMTIAEYKQLANSKVHKFPQRCLAGTETDTNNIDIEQTKRSYWKSMTTTAECPVYGADVLGSVFNDANVPWNVSKLDCLLRDCGIDIPGVTRSMMYVGMWRATFSLHNEDMNLFSINYIHTGSPKVWYAVPPEENNRLESLAQSLWPDEAIDCKDFLRHKTKLLSPQRLGQNGIKYTTCVHNAGEFMVTMASSYHFGFNCGFNVAESLNFVNPSLLPVFVEYGRKAKPCVCRPGSVRFDMDVFEATATQIVAHKQTQGAGYSTAANATDSVLSQSKEPHVVQTSQEINDENSPLKQTGFRVTTPKVRKRARKSGFEDISGQKHAKTVHIKNVVGKHGTLQRAEGSFPVIIRGCEGDQVRVHVVGTKREDDVWLSYPNDLLHFNDIATE